MNTLDDLIIGRNGLWFTLEEASKAFQHSDFLFMYDAGGSTTEPREVGVRPLDAVISKEKFQQRARELGYGVEAAENESWYCYETQKALRLPPVGEKVEFNYQTETQWEAVFVVAVHHYRKDLIIAPFERSGTLKYATELNRFRPLDWNRKAEAERKRCIEAVRDAYFDFGGDSYASFAMLYDAGFLRMPEGK